MTLGLFGNDLSSLIRKIVKEELNQPVKGLTPGIHASPSLTIDAAGRIRHIEAGSGGGVLTARVSKNPGFSLATSASLTGTTMTWTYAYDTANGAGMYSSGANDRLTAPSAGVYLSTLHILWSAWNAGSRQISLFWHDTSAATDIMIARDTRASNGDAIYQPLCAPPIYMDATDYIFAQVAQNSGTSVSVLFVSATISPTFSLTKL